jgi:acylphosphatase
MVKERRRLRVEGRVQGVGFREACVHLAHSLGLAGWVRNRFDGAVEVLAEGTPTAVAQLVDWLHRGPPAARVERIIDVDDALDELPERFARRPSA